MAQDSKSGLSQFDDEPIELDNDEPTAQAEPQPVESSQSQPSSKITTFGARQRHEDRWDRTPNVNGTGAIHCKVFHCKLREDALDFLEQQINEWLDKHPEYEVKQVTSSVGELKTKTMSEPAMFITVWV